MTVGLIQPGPASGESVIVLKGLTEGEQVIRNSQAVLGQKSLLQSRCNE